MQKWFLLETDGEHEYRWQECYFIDRNILKSIRDIHSFWLEVHSTRFLSNVDFKISATIKLNYFSSIHVLSSTRIESNRFLAIQFTQVFLKVNKFVIVNIFWMRTSCAIKNEFGFSVTSLNHWFTCNWNFVSHSLRYIVIFDFSSVNSSKLRVDNYIVHSFDVEPIKERQMENIRVIWFCEFG